MKIISKTFLPKASFILIFSFLAVAAQAQDYIYMKDGSEYKAKVEEITPEIIKFKKFDQPDGPVRTVKINDVISIRYQDGTEEIFTKTQEQPKETEPTNEEQYVYSFDDDKQQETREEIEKPKSKFQLNGHDRYVSLGGGFGNSYGGAGTRFQFRVGGIVGFGLHTGLGLYPRPFFYDGTGSFQSRLMFDFGVKLFCWKWIYIDLQMAMVGRDDDYYLYETGDRGDFSDVLFGPALLGGVDYIFGKHLGVNVGAGVSFPITDVVGNNNGGPLPETESNVYPAIDAGVFYKF
ncbi:MAG: hypothetical protein POELPBGB_00455 [Bacteroidia bacterium]|nr:hypothetical protein [Bacteroidia bacterium]